MCITNLIKRWRSRRRARIYEGPSPEVDGGTRIRIDKDAPKEINSRELIRFSCRFSSVSISDEDTRLKRGVYYFGASASEDGVSCTVGCNNTQVLRENRVETRSLEIMAELEALLREYDVAQYNGKYYKVSGLPDFYGAKVDAEYASGETLYCYNNQDPFLPIAFVEALCKIFGIEREAIGIDDGE